MTNCMILILIMMDMTLVKMKILFFPNYMHFLQESEVKLSLKCLVI
jgi:hypothetical protein